MTRLVMMQCLITLAGPGYSAAGTLITTLNSHYKFSCELNNTTTGAAFVNENSISVTHHVRDRNTTNRYAWSVQTLSATRERWSIEIDVLSAYYPETTQTDRFGNVQIIPETFADTEFESSIKLGLNHDLWFTCVVAAEGISNTPSFELNYPGMLVSFASGADGAPLFPPTNFPSNPSTTDPNDISDFRAGGFAPAGTYDVKLKFSSGYDLANNYRDGHARIVFEFSMVPPTPGDFDSDGDVDGADFVIWQTNFPAASNHTLTTGDADGDGDVDGADFVVWQTNFPLSPTSSSLDGQPVPVPEPSPVALAAISLFALAVDCRFRPNRSGDDRIAA